MSGVVAYPRPNGVGPCHPTDPIRPVDPIKGEEIT